MALNFGRPEREVAKTVRPKRGNVSPLHGPPREGQMAIHIGRRQVIFALGNAAVALPLVVRAQQPPMPSDSLAAGRPRVSRI